MLLMLLPVTESRVTESDVTELSVTSNASVTWEPASILNSYLLLTEKKGGDVTCSVCTIAPFA